MYNTTKQKNIPNLFNDGTVSEVKEKWYMNDWFGICILVAFIFFLIGTLI